MKEEAYKEAAIHFFIKNNYMFVTFESVGFGSVIAVKKESDLRYNRSENNA